MATGNVDHAGRGGQRPPMLVWRLCSCSCFGIIISDLFFHLPAVCLAAEAGSVGCLEVLIDQAMMDPTVGDEAGMTPLHFAAEAGTPTPSFQIGFILFQ